MSALLLDTHTFIWFSENDANLPDSLKDNIESAEQVYVSIASLWAIAIKLSIGKLSLQTDYASIEPRLEPAGIKLLPISFADTVLVRNLPLHHRDPFDRILFSAYSVQQLWN